MTRMNHVVLVRVYFWILRGGWKTKFLVRESGWSIHWPYRMKPEMTSSNQGLFRTTYLVWIRYKTESYYVRTAKTQRVEYQMLLCKSVFRLTTMYGANSVRGDRHIRLNWSQRFLTASRHLLSGAPTVKVNH